MIQRRSVVKKLLKKETNKEMKNTLNVRQLALKLTANSMYGCLGFSASRLYAAPIAALVTSQGREILQNTVGFALCMGLNVIYGDTDSIMIYTGSDDWDVRFHIVAGESEVKKAVNKKYKFMEIEIGWCFQKHVITKEKICCANCFKRQKDRKIHLEKETKGLDLVRRDWCGLSKEVGLFPFWIMCCLAKTVKGCGAIMRNCVHSSKSTGGLCATGKVYHNERTEQKPERLCR